MMPAAKRAAAKAAPKGDGDQAAAAKAAADASREAAQKAADEKAAKDKAAADKAAAKTAAEAASAPREHRVVALGASYSLPGKPESRRFALKGEVIEIDADEAARLRELGAVVGKNEPDPEPPRAPAGENPPGGTELESQEAHADKVKAAKASRGK